MKYLVSLLTGMIFGAAILVAALYFNPFASKAKMSPLAVTDSQLVSLQYSLVPSEMLLFTNDGESVRKPHPSKVQQLWEPAIQKTWVSVVELNGPRGDVAGVGIKFASDSEKTRPLNAEALVDSAWHIYLPGRGTMFVEEIENYWSLINDIVVPAFWNSADSWRGVWYGNITVGPGALGTGRVIGQSGEFAGMTSESMESIDATAYSAIDGPVGMNGNLLITVSRETASE
ncbi:MAG: hypothetical protein RLN69_00975 [Woeseiaceae bacterium]